MEFYKVRIDAEKVGNRDVFPLWEYNPEAPNSETKLKYDSLPDFEPHFSNLYITEKTDVINNSSAIRGAGFIINEKLKSLISDYRLDTHRFYKLKSFTYDTKEEIKEQYYWLQLISTDFEKHIDYDRSKFYLFNDLKNKKIKDLAIESPSHLKATISSTYNTDNMVMYSELFLKSTFYHYDLFYMHSLYDNIFNYPIISKRLKDAIEENDIVAFEFKKVPIFPAQD